MNIVTIPRKLAQSGDLVVISRQEYEELSALKKLIPVIKPTKGEMQTIRRGEKEIRQGKFVSWTKVKYELAH